MVANLSYSLRRCSIKIKLRGMKMFRKLAVLTALSVLIVAPALAGSCPAKMAAIDAALADGSAKNIDSCEVTGSHHAQIRK